MWILPYILPFLTVVSLFFYILSAERAWLPKMGTTEWIKRSVEHKLMSASMQPGFKVRDIFIFLGIAVVYGGILVTTNFTAFFEIILPIVYTAVSAGIIYLIGVMLFKNRTAAFIAAAMAAADLFLLKTFSADGALLALTAAFVFLVILGSDKPMALLPAGLILGAAAFLQPVCIVFTLLPMVGAIVSCVRCKSGKPILMYVLFALILPAAVYCGLSFFIYGSILISRLCTSFVPPVFFNVNYCIIAAVCFIISVIHIFRDKSYTALFISLGLVITALLMFNGINLIPLFAGFVIALPADIIIKRGKIRHKLSCIFFSIIMFIPVLYYFVSSVIEYLVPAIILLVNTLI